MSDLRNMNKSFTPAPSMAPSTTSEPIRDTNLERPASFEDKGGLSNFHHIDDGEGTSNTGRIAGAVIVALMIGAAGVYAYSSYTPSPKPQVADKNLPSPAAPKQVAAAAPPSSVQTAPTPSATDTSALQNSPYGAAPTAPAARAPASNDVSAPAATESKPVKSVRSHIARKDKDEAAQDSSEAKQTAQLNREADQATKNGSVPVPMSSAPPASVANATPLPQAPAAPSSSLAVNGQPDTTQSAPAQDIAPAPTVTPTQPAPTTVAPTLPAQTPAQDNPAPAQPQ